MFVPYIVSGIARIYDEALTLTVKSAALSDAAEQRSAHTVTASTNLLFDLVTLTSQKTASLFCLQKRSLTPLASGGVKATMAGTISH
jgi:hypothetical protein